MRITKKILSLPPYISTSWKNISMIAMEGEELIVELKNGTTVEIPNLDSPVVEEIFHAHEKALIEDEKKRDDDSGTIAFGFPLETNAGGLEMSGPFGNMMSHNSELSHSPDLPKEMLKKVTRVARSLGLSKTSPNLPKAEPHCNCPYCQIARALFDDHEEQTSYIEDEITDEELTFREWIIQDDQNNSFTVIDPNDQTKHFHVNLSTPITCTCGEKNCAHIQAVLRS